MNMEYVRCTYCSGELGPSGVEPHRHICKGCGQNFHLVLQLTPVSPLRSEIASSDAVGSLPSGPRDPDPTTGA